MYMIRPAAAHVTICYPSCYYCVTAWYSVALGARSGEGVPSDEGSERPRSSRTRDVRSLPRQQVLLSPLIHWLGFRGHPIICYVHLGLQLSTVQSLYVLCLPITQ